MPTCARDRQYVTTAEQTQQCRITLIMQSADSARVCLPRVGGRQGEAAAERAVVNDSPVGCQSREWLLNRNAVQYEILHCRISRQ